MRSDDWTCWSLGLSYFLINCESQVFLSTNLHSHLKDPIRTAFKHAGFMEVKPCITLQTRSREARGICQGKWRRRATCATSNLMKWWKSGRAQYLGLNSAGFGGNFARPLSFQWPNGGIVGDEPPKKMISM